MSNKRKPTVCERGKLIAFILFVLAIMAIGPYFLLPKSIIEPYFSPHSNLDLSRDDGNGLLQTLRLNSTLFTARSRETYQKLGPYLGQEEELNLVLRHVVLDDGEYIGYMNSQHQRHWLGSFFYRNGDIYEGHWKNGKRCGNGRQIEKDGSVYIGEFWDDMRVGLGTKDYTDGSRYTGSYVNDHKEGIGSMKSGDGSGFHGDESYGEWDHGKLHGRGAYFHRDGTMFVGNFQQYKRHGKGVMWNQGEMVCFGDWEQGQLSGTGTCLYSNGTVYAGQWVNGMKSGQGTLTYPGKVETGIWKNDE